MSDDSLEIINANISERKRAKQAKMDVLIASIGVCEALGESTIVYTRDGDERLAYKGFGLKIEPTSVPSEGYWVYQLWRHPKDRDSFLPTIQHTQFVGIGPPSSIRSILLERASVVEEILARDPIKWHHKSYGGLHLFSIAILCMFGIFTFGMAILVLR